MTDRSPRNDWAFCAYCGDPLPPGTGLPLEENEWECAKCHMERMLSQPRNNRDVTEDRQ